MPGDTVTFVPDQIQRPIRDNHVSERKYLSCLWVCLLVTTMTLVGAAVEYNGLLRDDSNVGRMLSQSTRHSFNPVSIPKSHGPVDNEDEPFWKEDEISKIGQL
ncbi:hypothetical protein TREMEDRAFT_60363 [Tremella mesenterica DSM 1558]|uniref:uncharacterized protein n=1 Tax=Tremella mesenterica (strain ATCC 24925 / CBS 8224 / DSM 1558 / NBRC 9311 / NRRL Y-6157 / RJB 2259-6 / UBC 559-6) TaxID=578456 RepID=UPI0003F4A045|nr:uncharacterized protein TREMEDRAFT_60363 [Tremella mesenterica DSM 1558]EIW71435.1 hypothetical protein TREMEDRAFT_60363 [Tremella mesenterica DSM 1558]